MAQLSPHAKPGKVNPAMIDELLNQNTQAAQNKSDTECTALCKQMIMVIMDSMDDTALNDAQPMQLVQLHCDNKPIATRLLPSGTEHDLQPTIRGLELVGKTPILTITTVHLTFVERLFNIAVQLMGQPIAHHLRIKLPATCRYL